MATFEEQLKALEAVVEKLEKGDIPLEESLRLFEEGVGLSERCKEQLTAAEGRVQVLLQTGRSKHERGARDLVLNGADEART